MVDWKMKSGVSQSLSTRRPQPHSTCSYLSLNTNCSNSCSYTKTILLQKNYLIYTKEPAPTLCFNSMPRLSSQVNRENFCLQWTSLIYLTLTQEKVVYWMNQYLNKKLPRGYQYADQRDRWRVDITAQDNYTTWLLRHYNIESTNRKSVPYFAVNLMVAKSMGWVVETSSN